MNVILIKNSKFKFMLLVAVVALVKVLTLEPVAQDLAYHGFADQRMILGIPNFWNVISNFPFLLVGLTGLYAIFITHRINYIAELKMSYVLFFTGVTLVAFGSGYYHLAPNNETLVWDRLPMTIAFMALFSVIIGEFVSCDLGKRALWPLVLFGSFSVLYWFITEKNTSGDLRPYIIVQFLPMLLIPVVLLFFKTVYTNKTAYWLLLLAYLLAKVLEHFDAAIYSTLTLVSGHSIKHVVAALGVAIILKSYSNRVKKQSEL